MSEHSSPEPLASDPRTADVYSVIDELTDLVDQALTVPLSDRVVISRNLTLDLLDEIRARLPRAVQEAEEILADRVGVVEDGYREAERQIQAARTEHDSLLAAAHSQHSELVESGRAEHFRLVDATEVARAAVAHAEAITAQAWAEADAIRAEASADVQRMRAEVDEYIDGKFASFEATLNKTLTAVQRGRDRLNERYGAPGDTRTG